MGTQPSPTAFVTVLLAAATTFAGPPSVEDTAIADQLAVVEEITVSAEKRDEALQKVPIAITAFSRRQFDLLGPRSSMDLAALVPNLEIRSAFGASSPTTFLRGVGLNDYNSNASGAIGYYTDEIYVSQPVGQIFQLFDLERVEVLRGPQGTLYGKNTTGGAINLVSRAPSGAKEGYARLRFGSDFERSAEGAVDVPLWSQTSALRLSFLTNHRDGITENASGDPVNDVNNTAARVQLRAFPWSDLMMLIKVAGGVNRSTGAVYQSRGIIDGANVLGYADPEGVYTGSYNRDVREDGDAFNSSLTLNWYQPGVTVTSLTAYQQNRRLAITDIDSSPLRMVEIDWDDRGNQVSQEFRLTSTSEGSADWILGAFYSDEEIRTRNNFDFFRELRDLGLGFDPASGIFYLEQKFQQDVSSSALFGQVRYRPEEKSTLRFGLRHTWETRSLALQSDFLEPAFTVPLIDFDGSAETREFTGEVGLSHQASDKLLLFASVSRGFKSGGFNGAALFAPEEVEFVLPEFVTSYEVGFKSSLADNRVHFNLTGFYYNYQDLQVFDLLNTGGVPLQVLKNASDARILGLEVETEARPSAALRLTANLGLLDSEYRDFVLSNGTSYSGNKLISAPDLSLYLGAEYEIQVGAATLTAHMAFAYRDDVFFSPANNPAIGSSGYGLLDGRLVYAPAGGNLTLALWAKNLTDREYLTNVFDLSDFGFQNLVFGEPRRFGVELGTDF